MTERKLEELPAKIRRIERDCGIVLSDVASQVEQLLAEITRLENLAMMDDAYRCALCERVFDHGDLTQNPEEPGVYYCEPCWLKVPLASELRHLVAVPRNGDAE